MASGCWTVIPGAPTTCIGSHEYRLRHVGQVYCMLGEEDGVVQLYFVVVHGYLHEFHDSGCEHATSLRHRRLVETAESSACTSLRNAVFIVSRKSCPQRLSWVHSLPWGQDFWIAIRYGYLFPTTSPRESLATSTAVVLLHSRIPPQHSSIRIITIRIMADEVAEATTRGADTQVSLLRWAHHHLQSAACTATRFASNQRNLHNTFPSRY